MSQAAAKSDTLHSGAQVVTELRETFRSGKTLGIGWRMEQLAACKRMIETHKEELIDAIAADLGKPRFEALTTEVAFVLSELEYTMKHLRKWMQPTRVRSSAVVMPATSKIYRDPLGVALVIGAWNYPFQLAIGPALGAIAAGNCVVIKPSEVSSNTSEIMAALIPKYLDQECIRVIEGGIPETTDLLEQKWDKIFYTGNSHVGRIVMTAAAAHLTPVTLELGGKCPAIVDSSADIKVAARRIAWGKFTNAGQTCVAPDYVLVHSDVYSEFLGALKDAILEFYGDDPSSSEDYGRIINERHHERLVKLLESGSVYHGGEHDVTDRYIAPTILTDVSPDSAVMSSEIFGPIFPVLKIDSVDGAIDFVNDRAKPLSLYIFTQTTKVAQDVLRRTSSGNGSINHVWMHMAVPALPFGGVGESGMGCCHGKHSFDTFSHQKAVLNKTALIDPSIVYPPYNDFKKKVIKHLL